MENKFEPMTSKSLLEVLGMTIKKDEVNKLITFLCLLLAYTEDAQFNVSFNAPSSTGKSYIPIEIAKLFPPEDVMELGYCSPAAFYHDNGTYEKEHNRYTVDLSRKIIIFLDQPCTLLLSRLRPLLSHDKKMLDSKIADKKGVGGNITKNVRIIGYPSVVFCSAGLTLDEQEATRFLLLSPEMDQEKARKALHEKILKETNPEQYFHDLAENPKRSSIIKRIRAIRDEKIDNVKIPSPELIEKRFVDSRRRIKARHSRDIGRLISIIKGFALINLWFREKKGKTIVANNKDIDEAFKIWGEISENQELNLPPFVYSLYRKVIYPLCSESENQNDSLIEGTGLQGGIGRKEIMEKYYEVFDDYIDDFKLRRQVLPMLEVAGLITQEQEIGGKRQLVYLVNTTANVLEKRST